MGINPNAGNRCGGPRDRRCAVEEKTMLMEAEPEIYFETNHYKGGPAVLVRLSRASDAVLINCLERA